MRFTLCALSVAAILFVAAARGGPESPDKKPTSRPTSDRPTSDPEVSPKQPAEPAAPKFETGVCWVRSADRASLEYLKKIGVRCVSVTPFAYGHSVSDQPPASGYRFSRFRGESIEGVREVIQLAHECGLEVMLKPHIWYFQRNGQWRADIAMTSDEDWTTWFAMYEKFLDPFMEMARAEKVASFCVGTELAGTVPRTDQWRRLIANCREGYTGKLTYSANWYKEYESIQFWGDLDQVGVQAYFPLSEKTGLTAEQLTECWRPWMKQLEAFSERVSKPVVFTEFGYRPVHETVIEPWKWSGGTRNPKAQATAFEGAFEAFEDAEWLHGVYVWKWFSPYTGSDGSTPREHAHDGFSPQGLPAERVISDWFKKRRGS